MQSLLMVLLLFVAVPSLAADERFQCFGTEPFWNAQIDGCSVTATAPGEEDQKFVITQRSYPIGMPPSYGQVIKAKGGAIEAVLTIRADAKCSDGMSDQEYTHEVWFLKGKDLVVGCCNQSK